MDTNDTPKPSDEAATYPTADPPPVPIALSSGAPVEASAEESKAPDAAAPATAKPEPPFSAGVELQPTEYTPRSVTSVAATATATGADGGLVADASEDKKKEKRLKDPTLKVKKMKDKDAKPRKKRKTDEKDKMLKGKKRKVRD